MCLPANEALKLAAKERAERAAALEEAFLAIKQATGVSTVEEMVEKFLNQGARRGMIWRVVVRCCDEAMLGSSGCRGKWCGWLRLVIACFVMVVVAGVWMVVSC